jgi:hypothetical protein
MMRFHAIAVIVALLSTPMALLVRGIVCDPAECKCMTVCTGQGSNSASHANELCGAAKHTAPMCGIHQGHHALDYGFIAPIAPTMLSAQTAAPNPELSREFVVPMTRSAISGFIPAPFEPPRS